MILTRHHLDARELLTRVSRICHMAESGGGLRAAQWEALRYLAQANRFSRSPAAVADYLRTTRSPTSQVINGLVARGLVKRDAHPTDGRRVRLALTPEGRQTLEADPYRALAPALSRLPKDTQSKLSDGLAALMAELGGYGHTATFGVCETCGHYRHRGARAQPGGPHRCGLMREPLSPAETRLICIEYRAATVPPVDATLVDHDVPGLSGGCPS